jgi:serine/threonine protein kinase
MQSEALSGTIIRDRYKLMEVLGKGGVGITYSAIDLHTQDRVAIKAVSLKQLDDWKQVELLEREARVLAQLDHPAIPKYLDYFQVDTEKDRLFYIVQQLAPGKSLFQLVEAGWRTTELEVKEIAKQILKILIYLHSLTPSVIHRDLKPHNLIRSESGKIYLVDFGAVQNTYYNTLMRGSTVVGTFGYMSPEQFQGKATPSSDLYSLGATVLYLLTHRSPAELPHDTLKIQFREQVNISAGFANWLEKILQPDLEDRFVSAQDALNHFSDRYTLNNTNKGNQTLFNLLIITASILGVIIGFNTYKWGILSRLGYLPKNLDSDWNALINYLETGGDPNVFQNTNILGQTFLFDNQNQEIVKLLIEKGADVNAQDHSDETALMHTNELKIAKLLIEKGADVNIQDANGRTALMHTINKEIAKLLIEKGADVNMQGNDGKTALMEARNKEIAELLISKGANVNIQDRSGQTALMETNHLNIAELLIAKGADVDTQNIYGRTALMRANHLQDVELLIEKGANVNTQDKNGETALMHANSLEIAELLIKKGADVNAQDKNGQTALMYTNFLEIAELLIEKGADVHAQDENGETALFSAIERSSYEIVALLVANGADVNAKNKNNQSVLDFLETQIPYVHNSDDREKIRNSLKQHGAKK